MAEREIEHKDVLVTAPLCAGSLSYRGQTYQADKRGMFRVPEEAVPELIRHGFTVVKPDKKP
jgi:hypothetical protein